MGFIESHSANIVTKPYPPTTQGGVGGEATGPLPWAQHSNPYPHAPVFTERLGGKSDVPIVTPGGRPNETLYRGDRYVAGCPTRVLDTEANLPLARRVNYGAYMASKRALDASVAVAFLVLLAPALLLLALLIYLEDGGPVFYSQVRVGRGGRLFRFYKFRSMVRNADRMKEALAHKNEADGPIFKIKDDPRVTRVGRVLRKYSLDELPQFANVLRGDMSLVGPRPHLPKEVEECCHQESFPGGYPWQRLAVPPGLICLREVTGRSNLSFTRWLELDLAYVRHRSLLLDLSILLRALPAVLRGDGAC